MAVTLREVAERAGFSIPSVSYALNDRGHLLRPATREKILRAAEELGYRANASARAIRTGRLGTVALVLSTHRNLSNLPPGMFAGIHDELEARGERLLMVRLPDERLAQDFAPKFLREAASDGLLIDYTHGIPQQMLTLMQKHRIPCVWLNSKQLADCVYPDDLRAGREATEHLLKLGHRRIVFVDYTMSGHYSSTDRHAGYEQAMQAAGLKPWAIREEVPGPDRVEYSRRWLAVSGKPTAVVGYGSGEPLAVSLACEDLKIAVATFGDKAFDLAGRVYTTWLTPDAAVGQAAVRMLFEKMKTPREQLTPRVIPFERETGSSCEPVANQGRTS